MFSLVKDSGITFNKQPVIVGWTANFIPWINQVKKKKTLLSI